MVKRCVVNNKKYLCVKTACNDYQAIKYTGSGLKVSELKKLHGKHCMVHEEILAKCPISEKKKFISTCAYFTHHFNIVESDEWLNMIPEYGQGGSTKETNATKGRIVIHKGENNKCVAKEQLESYLSDGWIKGFSMTACANMKNGRKQSDYVVSEETRKKLSETRKRALAEGRGKNWLSKKSTEEHRAEVRLKVSEKIKERWKQGVYSNKKTKSGVHRKKRCLSDDTKRKIAERMRISHAQRKGTQELSGCSILIIEDAAST